MTINKINFLGDPYPTIPMPSITCKNINIKKIREKLPTSGNWVIPVSSSKTI